MIICISTVLQGAMPQFATEIYKALKANNVPVKLCLPVSDKISLDDISNEDVIRYEYPETVTNKREIALKVLKTIESVDNPELWFCDGTTLSMIMAKRCKYSYKVFVHDPNPHKYTFNLRRVLRLLYINYSKRHVYQKAKGIVLMSNSSKAVFLNNNQSYMAKTQLLLLGAHLSQYTEAVPDELLDNMDYFLFFGAIEKYKNLRGLLSAYSKYRGNRKLVVAGKGVLSDEEKELLKLCGDKVVLINRFIQDQEMITLFRRCAVTILPYIEATQSGVIPMSYHFAKPVIISDLPGLAEFVESGKTGYVYHNEPELIHYMETIDNDYELLCKNAEKYEHDKLNFTKNVISLIN